MTNTVVGNELQGTAGNDTMTLIGSGVRFASGFDGDDTITGTNDADILAGNDGDDSLLGAGGDDRIFGQNGDDTLEGGAGDDEINAGNGDDSVEGGAGDDTLFGNDGDDTIDGGAGNDDLVGGAGIDFLVGGDGVDRLFGQGGDDTLIGSEGGDRLQGGDDDDTLFLGSGDIGLGEAGADLLVFLTDPDNVSYAYDPEQDSWGVFLGGEIIEAPDSALLSDWQDIIDLSLLYEAAFDRNPDKPGLDFWYGTGLSLEEVAGFFLDSPEFEGNVGANSSDEKFLDEVYLNVLGREADGAGEAFWLKYLSDGGSREVVLVDFALSPENAGNMGVGETAFHALVDDGMFMA